jgi:hypothetical protein
MLCEQRLFEQGWADQPQLKRRHITERQGRTVRVNAQQWAQDWVNGMTGAGDKIKRGVSAVQTAPGVKAFDAAEKMRANFIASVDSGRWGDAVLAVSLQQWQNAMIAKGLPRIQDGVRASQMKMQNYAQRAIPIYTALQAQIDSMPKRTLADSLQRVKVWMEGLNAQRANLKA